MRRFFHSLRFHLALLLLALAAPMAGLLIYIAYAEAQPRALLRNLAALGVMTLLAVLFAWIVSERLILRRVQALAKTAQRFGAGQLAERSAIVGQDEIGVLAAAFNEMGDRIVQMLATETNARQQMQTLLSILPEGVALLDGRGAVVLSNPVALSILRSGNGMMEGVNLAARVEHRDQPVQEFETRYDGRVFEHALARASAAGPVVWVFRELTERHRLMAQVLHRSKMADLGLLAAGIAHEIGNPLSSMSAIIQVLEHRKTTPEVVERLKSLEAHIVRIDKIVHQITDFARPSKETPTRLSTSSLIQKAAEIFHLHARSRETEVRLPPTSQSFDIDAIEDQLVQVLLNLLLNAADATDEAGSIQINVTQTHAETRIAIVDSGRGMSEETRVHLFTSFFTTKKAGRGVGLGLFVSEAIVRSHGGRIDVESETRRGSTFTVCLPRLAGSA